MTSRRGVVLVLCGVVLLLMICRRSWWPLPPSEQGLESRVAFPVTLDGLRELKKEGMWVSIERVEDPPEPCPPHAICLFNGFNTGEHIRAEVRERDRSFQSQVARLWFDVEGRFQSGWVHDGTYMLDVKALRSALIPRKVAVVERRSRASTWDDADVTDDSTWEPVPLLPQVDLLPDYHRAWEEGSPQVRSEVAAEVLRLYGDDALPFLRTHLVTPADVDAVYNGVLGVFCRAERSSLRLMTRVEVLSLFTREPSSAAAREAFSCNPEDTETPLPPEAASFLVAMARQECASGETAFSAWAVKPGAPEQMRRIVLDCPSPAQRLRMRLELQGQEPPTVEELRAALSERGAAGLQVLWMLRPEVPAERVLLFEILQSDWFEGLRDTGVRLNVSNVPWSAAEVMAVARRYARMSPGAPKETELRLILLDLLGTAARLGDDVTSALALFPLSAPGFSAEEVRARRLARLALGERAQEHPLIEDIVRHSPERFSITHDPRDAAELMALALVRAGCDEWVLQDILEQARLSGRVPRASCFPEVDDTGRANTERVPDIR